MTGMVYHGLEIPTDRIAAFCRKWRITEFSLFGSVLRDDFRPDSDVDVLVAFEPDARWSLFDLVRMEGDLERIVQRKVDLVDRKAVEQGRNWIRRNHILRNFERIL
jgi:predicted nucleotidyltransferase